MTTLFFSLGILSLKDVFTIVREHDWPLKRAI